MCRPPRPKKVIKYISKSDHSVSRGTIMCKIVSMSHLTIHPPPPFPMISSVSVKSFNIQSVHDPNALDTDLNYLLSFTNHDILWHWCEWKYFPCGYSETRTDGFMKKMAAWNLLIHQFFSTKKEKEFKKVENSKVWVFSSLLMTWWKCQLLWKDQNFLGNLIYNFPFCLHLPKEVRELLKRLKLFCKLLQHFKAAQSTF